MGIKFNGAAIPEGKNNEVLMLKITRYLILDTNENFQWINQVK